MLPADQDKKKWLDALPDLRRFALSLTRDSEQAEDLVQEVSLRLVRSEIPEDADLQRWAFRVCKNVWFDQLRRKKVRLEAAETVRELGPIVEDGAARTEERSELDFVMRAMSQLPDEQYFALSLVAIEGKSYREVAEITEVPIGTVMSRISRARGQIAAAIEKQQELSSGKGE
ncbi:RNA polymerase sigma factor [Qipengyuania sp.]|uniref:RNA polymerase sigma factor n=1 Tax=Qipengyuania sp. TaxID=2004515 RepID=UPI003BA8B1EE